MSKQYLLCESNICYVKRVTATYIADIKLEWPDHRCNFRGPQLLFLVAAVETMSRLTLLELAEPELRNFLLTVSASEVYLVRLGPQVHEVAE